MSSSTESAVDPGSSPDQARTARDPIAKSIRLLTWFADRGPQGAGVREIAAAFSMPPSSVHRLLASLEREGLVQRVDGGRYSMGLEFMRLAWRATASFPTRTLARPILEELAATSGETSLLGLYDPTRRQMFFAAEAASPYPLRYVIDLNEWISVDRGSSGLAILAFLPDAEVDAIVRQSAQPPDQALDELRLRLSGIREQGYVCTRSERIAGAVGIAAPVFGTAGRVVGDIVVTVPEQRFRAADEDRLADLTIAAAARLSETLSGS